MTAIYDPGGTSRERGIEGCNRDAFAGRCSAPAAAKYQHPRQEVRCDHVSNTVCELSVYPNMNREQRASFKHMIQLADYVTVSISRP